MSFYLQQCTLKGIDRDDRLQPGNDSVAQRVNFISLDFKFETNCSNVQIAQNSQSFLEYIVHILLKKFSRENNQVT